MSVRYILTCTKTGRYWTHCSEGMARRAALTLGLKDYEIQKVSE